MFFFLPDLQKCFHGAAPAGGDKRGEQLVRTSQTPFSDFHNELSVIPQRPTTFICPDSSQPPPFINPASRRRHAPQTPRVVYHVRWNRVSPAVNLGNGVTRGDPRDPRTNLAPQNVTRRRERKWWRFPGGGKTRRPPPAPLRTLNRRSGSALNSSCRSRNNKSNAPRRLQSLRHKFGLRTAKEKWKKLAFEIAFEIWPNFCRRRCRSSAGKKCRHGCYTPTGTSSRHSRDRRQVVSHSQPPEHLPPTEDNTPV